MRRGLLRELKVSTKDFFAPKKNHEETVLPLCPADRVMSRCHAQSGCNHPDIHPGDEHNRKHCRARGDIRAEQRLWETAFLGNNKLFKPPSIGFSYEAVVEVALTENLGDRSLNFIIDNPCLQAHLSEIVSKHVVCWYMANLYKFAWKEIWISEQRNNNVYKSSSWRIYSAYFRWVG